MSLIRSRWAAVGAAVAVTLGAGGIGLVSATTPADATTFIAITPCRLFDTRTEFNVGPKDTPLSAGQVHTVTAHGDNGNCTGIPNTAVAISMNMTALDATLPTFLTVWAAGATQPTASSLNPVPGAPPTPNAVTTELNGAGQFSVFNLQGNVNVFADINGYYVDHNHDDRYYTKTQADDRYFTKTQANDRFQTFGGTFQSADILNGATKAGGTITLPAAGFPTFTVSFGLPSGRDESRPILVQIPLQGPPNCAIVLSATGVAGPFSDNTRFLNTAWSVVGAPGGIVQFGPNPPGSGSSTTIVTLRNDSSPLGAGASVQLVLVRDADAAPDTCPSSVFARGGYGVSY